MSIPLPMWPNKSLKLRLRLSLIISTTLSLLTQQALAQSSFVDQDFFCLNFGCAIISDGNNFDIYDNYQHDIGACCVPFGNEMTARSLNVTSTNVTGSLDNSLITRLSNDQSLEFNIINAVSGGAFSDNGDGFLDASDNFSAFTLNSNTDIRLEGTGRQYSHSFFITSRRTRFSLRALASINNASGDFATTVQLGDIKLTPSFTQNGNDGGFQFGRDASIRDVQIVDGIDDLGDLTGVPTQIINFGRFRGVGRRSGSLEDQSLRLDFLYQLPNYDLSMGTGSLDIDVAFNLFREP